MAFAFVAQWSKFSILRRVIGWLGRTRFFSTRRSEVVPSCLLAMFGPRIDSVEERGGVMPSRCGADSRGLCYLTAVFPLRHVRAAPGLRAWRAHAMDQS
jgi:hypothetical protein